MPRAGRFTTILLALLAALPATGAVTLRWEPQIRVASPGETFALSLMLDDTLDVRTIDVVVDFDPTILSNQGMAPGALFDTVSCYVWPASEEDTPGHVHAFAAIIGASCKTTGPGELLHWTVTAGNEGWTDVTTAEVTLFDPSADRYADVTLPHAVVGVSATTGADGPSAPLRLELAPNPFNPRTRVRWSAPAGVPYHLEVMDLHGHRLAVLATGTGDDRLHATTWSGTDATGEPAASGIYLFRVVTPAGVPVSCRGVLVR